MRNPLDLRTLTRNTAANLANGAAGAVLAVVLPPFLVRMLSQDEFSLWALLLQIGGYTGLLNFGFQTVVGRFVSHAEATEDSLHRDRMVSTAIVLLLASAGLAMALIVVLAGAMPTLFPNIPAALHADARLALLLVGGSLALGLPFTAVSGVFVGLQRNEVPAAVISGGRIVTGAGLVLAAMAGQGVVGLAVVFAVVNVATYTAHWVALRRLAPRVRPSPALVDRESLREIIGYSASLSVWRIAMLMVTGLDVVIVARFDFPAAGAFAIAAGVVLLLQGAQSAVVSVLMPVSAALYARGERARLAALLFVTTRWNILAYGVAAAVLCLAGPPLIRTYVGVDYATTVAAILGVLLLGTATRQSMGPYSVFAVGTGDHTRIVVSPVVEGVVNLAASWMLAQRIGAIGVAWGTVIGGLVGVIFHLVYNLPRSERLGVTLRSFVTRAYGPAALAVTPPLALLALRAVLPADSLASTWTVAAVAVALSIAIAKTVTVPRTEFRDVRDLTRPAA